MVETASTMLILGTALPDFALPDTVSGKTVTAADARGERGTLVMFLCNHCPFVKHVLGEIERVARDAAEQGLGVVAVSSNDAQAYPDDSPERMKALARTKGWDFPYLHDESQDVAKAFRAACTPDFFLFDANARLVYRGRLDGSRPGNDVPVDGRDLRTAIHVLVEGGDVPDEQIPSVGCNIKWKPGNEPDWFR
jgi:thiol-disulfide isomerase/thioredoxin